LCKLLITRISPVRSDRPLPPLQKILTFHAQWQLTNLKVQSFCSLSYDTNNIIFVLPYITSVRKSHFKTFIRNMLDVCK